MLLKKIPKKNFPCKKHDSFLDEMIAKANNGFSLVTDLMLEAILRQMKQEKLAKTDPKKILELLGTRSKRGFTGNIPRVELDLSFTAKLIDKYMQAVKWMLMGKSAGREVEKIVEELGLKNKLPAGIIYGTFLNSVDVQREFYEEIYNQPAPKINYNALEYTLKFVNERSGKWCDKSLSDYKNKVLQEIQNQIEEFNNTNIGEVHKKYHDLLEEKDIVAGQIKTIEAKQDLIRDAMQDVIEHKMSLSQMKQHMKDTTKDYATDWDRLINTEFGLASGAGTHLAMQECFGGEDSDMLVANINVRDQKCCEICEAWSRNPDGSLKLYKLNDIKPAGYNIGKKRIDWHLTSASQHPNCRCTIMYVPKGFSVNDNGDLIKVDLNEKLKIETSTENPL